MSKRKNSAKSSGKKLTLSPGVTKKEKNKRAKYLSKRISNLFENISDWMSDDYLVKNSSVNYEGEKLPSINILSGKKTIASLKPSGLYAFGANSRIDIVSENETNILFDIAKEKEDADWQLISSEPGKKPKKLTKMILRNLLKRLK